MTPAEDFTASLLAETQRTTTMFGDRYKRFIPVDTAHTAILREGPAVDTEAGFRIGGLETEIDGVTVLEWFTAMLDGTEVWNDLVDPSLLE
jgi:hypothetical protein